jgi:hypothetical protein
MSASVSRDEPFSTLPYTSSVEICTNSFSSFERRASSRRTKAPYMSVWMKPPAS